jgi:hypothetical protein
MAKAKARGKRDPRMKVHTRYYVGGKRVPGASTIAKHGPTPFLIKWAWKQGLAGIDIEADKGIAANIGTAAHAMCESHLLKMVGKKKPFQKRFYAEADLEQARKSYQAYLDWEKKAGFKPILVEPEGGMVSKEYGYGGTLDAYGIVKNLVGWDGNSPLFVDLKALIDFKTSSGVYDSHVYQACAYEHMAVENGRPVDVVFILWLDRDKAGFKAYRLTDEIRQLGWECFLNRLASYKSDKAFYKPWQQYR